MGADGVPFDPATRRSWPIPTRGSPRCGSSGRCTRTAAGDAGRARPRRLLAAAAGRDRGRSGSTRSGGPLRRVQPAARNSLLEREGPSHTCLRGLVAAAFNRGHTARLEPGVHALAERLSTAGGADRRDGHAT